MRRLIPGLVGRGAGGKLLLTAAVLLASSLAGLRMAAAGNYEVSAAGTEGGTFSESQKLYKRGGSAFVHYDPYDGSHGYASAEAKWFRESASLNFMMPTSTIDLVYATLGTSDVELWQGNCNSSGNVRIATLTGDEGHWRGSLSGFVQLQAESGKAIVVWGVDYVPGREAHHPIKLDTWDMIPFNGSPGIEGIKSYPNEESQLERCYESGRTDCPSFGDFGYNSPIFFGKPPSAAITSSGIAVTGYDSISAEFNGGSPSAVTTSLGSAATAYGFLSDGPNFAKIVLPDALPGGDDSFDLLFGNTLVPVSAGSVFNFASHVPGGVHSFVLLGIDPAEGFDPTAPPPFVTGLQFTGEGITTLYAFTYSPVPEPSTIALLAVCAISLLAFAWRRTHGVPKAREERAPSLRTDNGESRIY